MISVGGRAQVGVRFCRNDGEWIRSATFYQDKEIKLFHSFYHELLNRFDMCGSSEMVAMSWEVPSLSARTKSKELHRRECPKYRLSW